MPTLLPVSSNTSVASTASSAPSTQSAFNPLAALFTPTPTSSTNITSQGTSPAASSLVTDVDELSLVNNDDLSSDRQSRPISRERSSSVRRSYSGDRASSPVRSASVPRSFAPPPISSTVGQDSTPAAKGDGYKLPLVVDGAGPSSRFGTHLDPTVPAFVPLPASSRPLQATSSPLDPLAQEFTMDSMIVARAQVPIILGLPVPDEYVMCFQTSIVPMPCVFRPGQTLEPQYTTCADASASTDSNSEAAEFQPQNYLQNTCRDFLWTPLSAPNPTRRRRSLFQWTTTHARHWSSACVP